MDASAERPATINRQESKRSLAFMSVMAMALGQARDICRVQIQKATPASMHG
jgi:hypothetical protein